MRGSPSQLPSSGFAAAAVFAGYLIIALAIVTFTERYQSLPETLGTITIAVALQALVTYLLLLYKGYQHRFLSTWSALLGTNTIMLLVLFPLSLILLNSEINGLKTFADSATWICLGWWLAIAGHIYHKSVGVSILQGSVITFMVELIGVLIAANMFPR